MKGKQQEHNEILDVIEESGLFEREWELFCSINLKNELTLKQICFGFYAKGFIDAFEVKNEIETFNNTNVSHN